MLNTLALIGLFKTDYSKRRSFGSAAPARLRDTVSMDLASDPQFPFFRISRLFELSDVLIS